MTTGRQIIAYFATSGDGFIARPDGDVSWLDRPRPKGDYGMPAFLSSIDTVIMGRCTWEAGQQLGGGLVEGKRNIVLSRSLLPFGIPGASVENVSPEELSDRLRGEKGSDIWLMGGARVFSEFLTANAIDQIVMHVVPVLIGSGMTVLDAMPRHVELTLRSTRRFSDGVVRLHYDVQGRASDLTETDEDAARATATG